MTRHHLLLPALPLMALLAFLLLAPSPSRAQDATVTFDPPTGAPGAVVSVVSVRQGAVCPLFAVDQTVVWDDQQVIGQVEGNSCIGWRGSFTVPRDTEPGGHAVSTRS